MKGEFCMAKIQRVVVIEIPESTEGKGLCVGRLYLQGCTVEQARELVKGRRLGVGGSDDGLVVREELLFTPGQFMRRYPRTVKK